MKIYIILLTVCSLALADVNNISEDLLQNDQVQNSVSPLYLDFKAVSPINNDAVVSDDTDQLIQTIGRGPIVDAILGAVEDLREYIIEKLDPLQIEHAGPAIFTLESGTRVTATANNFRAEGLRWFVVDDVYVNALRLAVGGHVTLPWLLVTGTYDVEARVNILLTHKAGGNFRIFVNRFEAGIDLRLGTSLLSGSLFLRELDIKLFMNDLTVQVDGMTGSSVINSYINRFINNLTQDFIQNHMNELSELISSELFDAVNDLLQQLSLSDITRK